MQFQCCAFCQFFFRFIFAENKIGQYFSLLQKIQFSINNKNDMNVLTVKANPRPQWDNREICHKIYINNMELMGFWDNCH